MAKMNKGIREEIIEALLEADWLGHKGEKNWQKNQSRSSTSRKVRANTYMAKRKIRDAKNKVVGKATSSPVRNSAKAATAVAAVYGAHKFLQKRREKKRQRRELRAQGYEV